MDESLAYEILSAVEEIPPGCVATYGQIARLIGRERNARLVGRVCRYSQFFGSYPCHRVVDHSGRLVPGWPEQRDLLLGEGVPFRDRVACRPEPLPLAALAFSPCFFNPRVVCRAIAPASCAGVFPCARPSFQPQRSANRRGSIK